MTQNQPLPYNLPELPDPAAESDPEARQLMLFRADEDGGQRLGEPVTLEDARAYCSRGDTVGDGWFVGMDRKLA